MAEGEPDHADVLIGPCSLGKGLFAARAFAAGELILRFRGSLIDFRTVLSRGEAQANPLQIGLDRYIDLEAPGVFANHSCDPNAGIRNDVELIALQGITSGEEIRYDYSTTMWEDHWTMRCDCRTSCCRGVIADFHTLPQMQQRSYLHRGIVQRFIAEPLTGPATPDAVSA